MTRKIRIRLAVGPAVLLLTLAPLTLGCGSGSQRPPARLAPEAAHAASTPAGIAYDATGPTRRQMAFDLGDAGVSPDELELAPPEPSARFSTPVSAWSRLGERFGEPHARGGLHPGVDFIVDGPGPVPILAGCDGNVVLAGSELPLRVGVIVDCGDDWEVLVAFQGELQTEVGAGVAAGTSLGLATGSGTWVHFEIRWQGLAVDPGRYLDIAAPLDVSRPVVPPGPGRATFPLPAAVPSFTPDPSESPAVPSTSATPAATTTSTPGHTATPTRTPKPTATPTLTPRPTYTPTPRPVSQ